MTDIADLSDVAAELDWLDYEAETKAHDALVARHDLGRLTGLVEWLAGVQAQFPIREISRPRLVVVACDHDFPNAAVTTLTAADTSRTVAAIRAGEAPLSELAARAGTGIRIEELTADSPVLAAIQRGVEIADTEIDEGTDLIIAANLGAGSTTVAATVVSILAAVEPIKVIGRGGSGIDDTIWMHKVAAVRDARRRGWPRRGDPIGLLSTLAGADLALLAGLMLRAAVRRTPVLLDGVVAAAAALLIDEAKPGARRWSHPAQRSGEPALAIVLDRFSVAPILDLGLAAGDGRGGLLALDVLRAAYVLSQTPDRSADV